MKKYITLCILICIMLPLIPSVSSLSMPSSMAISSAADFAAMEPNGNYRLEADIVLEAPYTKEFTGSFDGNGRTVTVSTAMFTRVNNAYIANFTVNGDINTKTAGHTVDGNDFAAAVAIIANGNSTFENIISNVNFTTKSSNTRYGAIAATSEDAHSLTIDGCINNGNITVEKYAGGIYGWTAQYGNSVVRNCINNGSISAGGYCGGVIARLGVHSGTMTVENCINNADITSRTSYCGGIYGYSNTVTSVTRCINKGSITGFAGDMGGIGSCVAQNNALGDSLFQYNANFGNVTNRGSGKTGGIVGYIYGTGNSFAVMIGNVNYGKITGKDYTSQIIAYTNSNSTVIKANIGAGSVSGMNSEKALFVGLSSATITSYKASYNYYIENDGTKTYSYADDNKYATNRLSLDQRPEGALTFVTAEQLASGEIADILNYELAADIFEVRDGKTVLKCKHVYIESEIYAEIPVTCTESGKTAGYKCSACNAVIGCEEIPATGHAYENGACAYCGEADPTATEALTEAETSAPETEPAPEQQPPDIIPMIVALTAVTVLIAATTVLLAIKKKKQ